MFRHKNNSPVSASVIPTTKEVKDAPRGKSLSGRFEGERDRDPSSATASLGMTNKTFTSETAKPEPSLKELIEKNLKWSQIIYEQNRKINNKLLLTAIAEWLKVLLIVVPLVLGVLFLGPLLKGAMSQYGDLLGNGSAPATDTQKDSMSSILLKWSNLDPAKQEQLKALFK